MASKTTTAFRQKLWERSKKPNKSAKSLCMVQTRTTETTAKSLCLHMLGTFS